MAGNPPHAEAALSTTAPSLPPDDVGHLACRLYGIEGAVTPLAGERDQNCRIETADGTRYVVKIGNPSEPVPVVDFQIAALEHIARASARRRASCGRWTARRAPRRSCPTGAGAPCGC